MPGINLADISSEASLEIMSISFSEEKVLEKLGLAPDNDNLAKISLFADNHSRIKNAVRKLKRKYPNKTPHILFHAEIQGVKSWYLMRYSRLGHESIEISDVGRLERWLKDKSKSSINGNKKIFEAEVSQHEITDPRLKNVFKEASYCKAHLLLKSLQEQGAENIILPAPDFSALTDNTQQHQQILYQALFYLLSHHNYDFVNVFLASPRGDMDWLREQALQYYTNNNHELQKGIPNLYLFSVPCCILLETLHSLKNNSLIGFGEFHNPYIKTKQGYELSTARVSQDPEYNHLKLIANIKPINTGTRALIGEAVIDASTYDSKNSEFYIHIWFGLDKDDKELKLKIYFSKLKFTDEFVSILKGKFIQRVEEVNPANEESPRKSTSPRARSKRGPSKKSELFSSKKSVGSDPISPSDTDQRVVSKQSKLSSPRQSVDSEENGIEKITADYRKDKQRFIDPAGRKFEVCITVPDVYLKRFITEVCELSEEHFQIFYDPDGYVQPSNDEVSINSNKVASTTTTPTVIKHAVSTKSLCSPRPGQGVTPMWSSVKPSRRRALSPRIGQPSLGPSSSCNGSQLAADREAVGKREQKKIDAKLTASEKESADVFSRPTP